MLNSALVEQFGSIHRQHKSGVLTVVGNGFRLRFCLQNGDPVAMDFCADKEVILANTLLDFHKVAPELHQHLIEARRDGKGTVAEIVKRRQVANEEELGQVTRAMVEDTLVRCFGSMHYEMVFDERDGIDTFDFDTTAIRLRIGTDVLLSTVQSRVAEIDRVAQEVGGGEAVFNFAESESGSVPLNEYEKHVLNFIDGHKTVDEIAIAFRESTLNMSRLIAGMAAKGVVQRAAGSVSRLKAAALPAATTEVAHGAPAATASTAGIRPPPPPPPPKRSSTGMLVTLGSILALVVVIWMLTEQWRGRNAALESANNALDSALAAQQWSTAAQLIGKSDQDAGNDLEAKRRVAAMQQRYEAAVKGELEGIDKLLEQSDFPTARRRMDALPEDQRLPEQRKRLLNGEVDFSKRSNDLRDRVGKLLDAGNTAGAIVEIGRAPAAVAAAGTEFLERWRLTSLERAASASLPISQRMALIEQVGAAQPTPHQREQIERIKAEFTRLQQRSTEQVRNLKKQSTQGAFAEVAAEYERLHLGDQMRGTPMAAESEALRQGNDRIRDELNRLNDDGLALVKNSDDVKAMSQQIEAINHALAAYPQASNAASLKIAAQLLADMVGLVGERTANDEAAALESWLQDRQAQPEITALVRDRQNRLHGVETAAEEALDNAHAFVRLDEWDQAQHALEDLIAHKEWARTAAHAGAVRDLDDLGAAKAKQKAWQDDLNRAMLAGDIDECYRIQQKMGLKYLPMLVQTRPAGAEVWREGKLAGTTPCTFDLPAGEREAAKFELRKAGFADQTITGKRAEGGWLLQVDLERETAARYDLAMTITAQPTAIAGKLWLANRQQAVSIAAGGKPERLMIEPGTAVETLGQPLYAAPVGADDAIYFATREGIAIRTGAHGNERLVLGGRTDLAIVVYPSQVIVSRRFLIVAGLDGVLHANDDRTSTAFWNGPPGEPFSGPPRQIGDKVMVARRDGTIEIYQADDGHLLARRELGAGIVAVWSTEQGLAGLTANQAWTCDGQEPVLSKLPQVAVSGGEDVFLTSDNHVWLRAKGDQEWRDLGRVEGKLSAHPCRWNDHAVIPLGGTLAVLGARGFRVAATGDFLAPVVLGAQLAVATSTGQVFFYSP